MFQNHRCKRHQYQYNNPNYPTSNSYLRRLDERRVPNPSQIEARPDMLQIGASTPVGAPSRATASAVRSHSSTPQQQYTSSSPQPQTYHEQPDRRRDVTPHPPGRMPSQTPTPTQASLPAHPATETQTPSKQHDHQRDVTPHPPGRMPSQTPTPTQASLSPLPANEQMLSDDDAHAFYHQPLNPTNPAVNEAFQPSGRLQNNTTAPNPSYSTSRLSHDNTSRATSSNLLNSDSGSHGPPNRYHNPRPRSTTLENHSTNTLRPTRNPARFIQERDYYRGRYPGSSQQSIRFRLRLITEDLYQSLHDLQSTGCCPNAEPLGPDWIDIEPTSVLFIREPEGGPPILDIIVDMLYRRLQSNNQDLDMMARVLLQECCKESEQGERAREELRTEFRENEGVGRRR